eukprot:s2093_g2.t1
MPDNALVETLATVGRPGEADGSTREALQRPHCMDGDIPSGASGIELLRGTNMCTAYALEKLDLAGSLLRFLKHSPSIDEDSREGEGSATIDMSSWESLKQVLASQGPGGMQQLVRALHAIIEIGERFPVWHQKRERGLRALTDPVSLKLKHMQSTAAEKKQLSVPVEPIAPLSELRRYLLRVTPVVAEGYLCYCHAITGATIMQRVGSGDFEKATVTGFEVLIGEVPLPIHTIQRQGKEPEKVLLAMREHRLVSASLSKSAERDLAVALYRLLVFAGCTSYPELVKCMRGTLQASAGPEMEESPTVSQEVENLRDIAMEAAIRCGNERACQIFDAELARIAEAEEGAPKGAGNAATDNTVHPHMRAHTVSLVASDEIPFDVFWPMVRDDILGAVREACPRGHHSAESAIQALLALASSVALFLGS